MVELVVRLVFSLAVVLGLLWMCARIAGRRVRGRSGALVQVLQRQAISRNAAVTVVSVGQRVLVLGTTEQQVQVLAELDPADVAELAGPARQQARSDGVEDAETSSSAPRQLPAEPVRRDPAPARVLSTPVVPTAVPAAVPAAVSVPGAIAPVTVPGLAPLSAAIAAALAGFPTEASAPAGSHRALALGRPESAPTTASLDTPPESTPAPESVAGALLQELEMLDRLTGRAESHRRDERQLATEASDPPLRAGRSARPARPTRPPRAPRAPRAPRGRGPGRPPQGRLTGSVLAPQTWRQAWSAMTGRAS